MSDGCDPGKPKAKYVGLTVFGVAAASTLILPPEFDLLVELLRERLLADKAKEAQQNLLFDK